jgi:hypothetical protein
MGCSMQPIYSAFAESPEPKQCVAIFVQSGFGPNLACLREYGAARWLLIPTFSQGTNEVKIRHVMPIETWSSRSY